MLRGCLLLLVLAASCHADGGIAYRGPPPVKEVFHYNDRSYFLYSDKVSWEEASAICQSNKGYLAVVDDSPKAGFLAQAIADAWAPFEDLWIGGQKVQNMWQWAEGGAKIPDTTHQAPNSTYLYPPWVDGSMPLRPRRDCLGIDRNGHSDPFFIDIDCKLPRSFICEVHEKASEAAPTPSKKVQFYDTEYVLYHGRLSWDAAVAFCRSNGFVLASVLNSTIAEKLAKAMLKTRPEFEDVWIGGSFRNGKWVWVENSLEIPEVPTLQGDVMFPPWLHVPPKPGKNCILFDRHMCEDGRFIDVKCNRVRDFVCARTLVSEISEVESYDTVTYREKRYIVHYTPATFYEAKIICEDEKNDRGTGRLLFIDGGAIQDPYDEVLFIMQIMADNKDELIHVWLAAQYEPAENAFKWAYDSPNYNGSREDNKRVLLNTMSDVTGYPPWCAGDTSQEMICLNLDRQNYNTPLFYSLECNVTQAVICVLEAIPKGVTRYHVNGLSYQTTDFNVTETPISWEKARRNCEEDTGYMLTDVDESTLVEVFKHLADGQYYIGIRYDSKNLNEPHWVPSQAPVSFTNLKLPPHRNGEECVVAQWDSGKTQINFQLVDCNREDNINNICRDNCGEVIDEVKDHSWHCTWVEGVGVTEGLLGKSCDKKCPLDQVLVGTRQLVCTTKGWRGPKAAAGGECQAPQQAALKLKEMLNLQVPGGKKRKALFIFDLSSDVGTDVAALFKYLIGTAISTFPLSAARSRRQAYGKHARTKRQADGIVHVPFIILSSTSKEVILIQEADPCAVIEKFKEANFTNTTGRRDYGKAFYSASQLIEEEHDEYIIVLISAGPSQVPEYLPALQALRKVAKGFVTIGAGPNYVNRDLSEIASLGNEKRLNVVGMQDYAVLKQLADAIPENQKCEKELLSLRQSAQQAVENIDLARRRANHHLNPDDDVVQEPVTESQGQAKAPAANGPPTSTTQFTTEGTSATQAETTQEAE